jgi:hypothetical protein
MDGIKERKRLVGIETSTREKKEERTEEEDEEEREVVSKMGRFNDHRYPGL